MAKKKKELSQAEKVGIGIGLTAAAVTAAGAYFLYGSKDAPKNRQKVKSWALKAKAEVLETLEKAESITEQEYKDLVEGVMKTYGKAKSISTSDIKEFQKEMADNWKGIVKSGTKSVVAATSVAKKLTKTKKPTKKAPAKKAVKKAPAKKVAKKSPAAKTAKKA